MEPKDLTPSVHKQVMDLSDKILSFLGEAGKSPNLVFLALCMTLARMSATTPSYTLERITRFTTGFRSACESAKRRQQSEQDKQWN